MYWATKILAIVTGLVGIGFMVTGHIDRGIGVMAISFLLSMDADLKQSRKDS